MPLPEYAALAALALHTAGLRIAYTLMRSRPDAMEGLLWPAACHVAMVAVAALIVPFLVGKGRGGRIAVCGLFLAAVVVRLPGVDLWLNDVVMRCVMQLGQGALAAASYWLFFTQTPRDKWVWRCIAALLTGTVGSGLALAALRAAVPTSPSVLFLAAGGTYILLAVAASAAVMTGVFSAPDRPPLGAPERKRAGRSVTVLAANTLLIGAVICQLTGWVGTFQTKWSGDAAAAAVWVVLGLVMLAVGWNFSRNFARGFLRMVALCAMLCVAIATLSVLHWDREPMLSAALIAIGCQIFFYTSMTLAMARAAGRSRLLGLAAVTPYAALVISGVASYEAPRLYRHDAAVVIPVCLLAFALFYYSTRRVYFGPTRPGEPERPTIEQVYERLSRREQDVARLLSMNLPTADIAAALFVSRHTVNSHVRRICEKSGLNGRDELVAVLRDSAPGDS